MHPTESRAAATVLSLRSTRPAGPHRGDTDAMTPAASIPAFDADDWPTLRRGMWLPEVEDLQALLGVEADGLFGPRTEAALKERQRSLDLVADGICGPKTWAALRR